MYIAQQLKLTVLKMVYMLQKKQKQNFIARITKLFIDPGLAKP